MGNCTINGVRARCKDAQGNGPYWFCANGGHHSASVDDDDTWGVNHGDDFYSSNVNPCISAPSGKNKYTVCIKITFIFTVPSSLRRRSSCRRVLQWLR